MNEILFIKKEEIPNSGILPNWGIHNFFVSSVINSHDTVIIFNDKEFITYKNKNGQILDNPIGIEQLGSYISSIL